MFLRWPNYFLEILENISKVFFFAYFVTKKPLETWKSFITSDFNAPLTVSVSGFTHNPAFFAVTEFKMATVAELVDLTETEGASSSTERDKEVLTILDV